MKLALISTPRSSSTWLRYLLARVYGLQQHAVHYPEVLDWGSLPDNCIVQMHWNRTEQLLQLMRGEGGNESSIDGKAPCDQLHPPIPLLAEATWLELA